VTEAHSEGSGWAVQFDVGERAGPRHERQATPLQTVHAAGGGGPRGEGGVRVQPTDGRRPPEDDGFDEML
jgi:hypothetical protein